MREHCQRCPLVGRILWLSTGRGRNEEGGGGERVEGDMIGDT